ncbi:hypothetical protein [Nocardiopsis alkaliphila]|uniref:hypothetical protein n=1 Tax=Nocardiopsis alkaliphila TaxID=225762 RepID=UPI0003466357|nr:hypothetical protein [Nocardiopsis alkaliphila]
MPNESFRILTPASVEDAEGIDDPVMASVIDAGHRPPAARVEELVETGRPILVRCAPQGQGPREPAGPSPTPATLAGTVPVDAAEEVALATVYAWAGARVIVTDHPERVRRALEMVASIRGERPPTAVRRGLV